MTPDTDPAVLRDELDAALVEALASAMWEADAPQPNDLPWVEWVACVRKHPTLGNGVEAYRRRARACLAGPLATLRTDLAAREAEIAGLRRDLAAAIAEMSAQATARGEAEGRLAMSGKAGIIKGWRERCEALEAALQPFAGFAEHMVDENGWTSSEHRASISTWFGPSEFRAARAALPPREAP